MGAAATAAVAGSNQTNTTWHQSRCCAEVNLASRAHPEACSAATRRTPNSAPLALSLCRCVLSSQTVWFAGDRYGMHERSEEACAKNNFTTPVVAGAAASCLGAAPRQSVRRDRHTFIRLLLVAHARRASHQLESVRGAIALLVKRQPQPAWARTAWAPTRSELHMDGQQNGRWRRHVDGRRTDA